MGELESATFTISGVFMLLLDVESVMSPVGRVVYGHVRDAPFVHLGVYISFARILTNSNIFSRHHCEVGEHYGMTRHISPPVLFLLSFALKSKPTTCLVCVQWFPSSPNTTHFSSVLCSVIFSGAMYLSKSIPSPQHHHGLPRRHTYS